MTVCRPPQPSPGPRRIAAELTASAGFALPGTVTDRRTRCGQPGCRCHADPPRLHGPYRQWTRKIAGKTVTRRLTADQLADYQPCSTTRRNSAPCSANCKISPSKSSRQAAARSRKQSNGAIAPENVSCARLTCGQPSSQTPFPQLSPKREDLSSSET